jgi:hypothetical protein
VSTCKNLLCNNKNSLFFVLFTNDSKIFLHIREKDVISFGSGTKILHKSTRGDSPIRLRKRTALEITLQEMLRKGDSSKDPERRNFAQIP